MDGKSMFGDIKSKLGFGRKNDYEEFYEDYEEFEEGDDYGEYGYDESYERTSGSAYDPYDSVTTREPGERSRSRSSMPRLVSIDDVRARTAVPTLPDDDAPATRRGSSSSFRTMVDSSLPPQMTPEGTAAASAAASAVHHARSEGLNSLFESTTPPADTRSTSSRGSSASSSRFTPSRTLKVVAPGAYNDAEAVSTALKLGNAVVLNRCGQRSGRQRGMRGQQGVRPHSHRRAHRGRALLPAHPGHHLAPDTPSRPSDKGAC